MNLHDSKTIATLNSISKYKCLLVSLTFFTKYLFQMISMVTYPCKAYDIQMVMANRIFVAWAKLINYGNIKKNYPLIHSKGKGTVVKLRDKGLEKCICTYMSFCGILSVTLPSAFSPYFQQPKKPMMAYRLKTINIPIFIIPNGFRYAFGHFIFSSMARICKDVSIRKYCIRI